jgi:DNA-directed RNA polymerase subunit beta'
MRTFHIGGTASRRAEQTTLEARNDGLVQFINLQTVTNNEGDEIIINRNGELAIIDVPEAGRERERERYPVVYGAEAQEARRRQGEGRRLLVEWDPYTLPTLTQVGGTVKFGDLIEGVTVEERVDERTGLSTKVVIDTEGRREAAAHHDQGRRRQHARLPNGNEARYQLPVGVHLNVYEGQALSPGDIIAKMPRETTKTKDITGGLPRVAELFEARKPKEFAVVSEIDGLVSFGKDTKGKRKVVVTPEVGEAARVPDPERASTSACTRTITCARASPDGRLVEPARHPHDLGEKALAKYLVDEVQEIYRLQGVRINDKHIEVIVDRCCAACASRRSGDAEFLVGDQVEKWRFEEANQKIEEAGGEPATAEPLLLGITKASLSTESFISAASFQETTKVLTEAAINGKVDRPDRSQGKRDHGPA